MLSTVECAACAVAVAATGWAVELEELVTVAVESVTERVAVADGPAPAEVEAVAYAQALDRVDVFGAAALIVAVAAGVEQVALAGSESRGAVEAGLGLEAVVVEPVAVAVGVAETDSAGEVLAVVVGGLAALDEGTARVLDEMADLRRRTVD